MQFHTMFINRTQRSYAFCRRDPGAMRPWGQDTKLLYKEMSSRLVDASGDPRFGAYFGQRISLAVQRGNAASLLGTLPTVVIWLTYLPGLEPVIGQVGSFGRSSSTSSFPRPDSIVMSFMIASSHGVDIFWLMVVPMTFASWLNKVWGTFTQRSDTYKYFALCAGFLSTKVPEEELKMVRTVYDAEAPAVKEEIPHDHLFRVTGLSSSNLEKLAQEAPSEASDFESAIAATSYGKFNLALMLCTLPAFWSAVTVTSSVSYIFTKAQCDMELSLLDMGTVTAITYAGMISSAMIWGFLSDTLGRKKIMVWGFFASGLLEMTAAMSQNFAMLLVTRYLSGFLFNGPFAVLISYIAELHRTELRARAILLTCLFYTMANTALPLLAWGFLTNDWDFELFGGWIVIHSWNLFLLTTALIPLLTGLCFLCLPESPKFLMSRGRNEEAMEVFRKIFALNTGRPKEEFPIKRLVEEQSEQMEKGMAALKGGFKQMAPLFKAPHGYWLLLMCSIHIGSMFGTNTLRLWFPQLAAMIGSDANESLCSAIKPVPAVAPLLPEELEICQPIETNMMVYLQSAIVGAGSMLTFGIGGMIVNKCGKKIVAGTCGLVAAILIVMLPFVGTGAFSVVAIVCTALAFTSLSGASLSSIMVDLFPTSLRVMAMATFLMCGRIGTMAGTVTFPALMAFGCLPPFFTIGAVLTVCALACFVVPKTTLKKMV